MAEGCICGIPNTGKEGCPVEEAPIKALYMVKLVSDAGVRNGYPIATVLDQAELDSRINDSDPSERWYPLTSLDFLTPTVTDPASTTGQFGNLYYGFKKAGETMEATIPYASRMDANLWTSGFGCGQWGVFAVDMKKQVQGYISDDGDTLYPARIATGSFFAKYLQASLADNLPSRAVITYSIDISNDDAAARTMTGVTADILNAQGLQTLEFVYSSVTATGFVLTATQRSAKATAVPRTGLVQADFVHKNKTTDATIAFTAFSETADGVYSFTHASQTTGVTRYTVFSRTTFDGGTLAEQTITTP